MKKAIVLMVALGFGCAKEEGNCKQSVYKKDGAEWILINSASWEGPDQYKNYTKTIWYEDGSFDVIKTIVTCN